MNCESSDAVEATSCCGLPGWAVHAIDHSSSESPLCALANEDGGKAGHAATGDRAVRFSAVRDRRLYAAGHMGDCVYVLKSGIVKEVVTAEDGSSVVVRLVTAGGVTGLEALAGLPYRRSAIVLHPGTACRIPISVIRRYQQLAPESAHQMCDAWQRAVEDAERILRLGHGTARSRIARVLQFLKESVPAGESIRVRRTDIADLLGLTEVTVGRALAELRTRGLLSQIGWSFAHIDSGIATLEGKHAAHIAVGQ